MSNRMRNQNFQQNLVGYNQESRYNFIVISVGSETVAKKEKDMEEWKEAHEESINTLD